MKKSLKKEWFMKLRVNSRGMSDEGRMLYPDLDRPLRHFSQWDQYRKPEPGDKNKRRHVHRDTPFFNLDRLDLVPQ